MYIGNLKYLSFLDVGFADLPKQTMDWSLMIKMLGQFFFLILICAAVIYAASYFTKKMGQTRFSGNKDGNLKIIESMFVGYGQTVHLVRAGNKCLLIGVTKGSITFLSEVDSDSVHADAPKQQIDLRSYLKSKNITFKK